jgi:hypothetical protein
MTSIRCLALAIALALPAAPAGAAGSATGHYRMGDLRFDVKSGVAIRLWQDAGRETFGVVLGEGPFDPKAAVGALDPLDAIAESAPADSGVVLLWIRPGFDRSLEFGSVLARPGSFNTNGDGNEKVTVSGERIRGEWVKPSTAFTDKTWELTVRFDLPLTAIADPGTPLPPDGGAPGKAYRDFLDALSKKDRDKVMALQAMPADMVEILGPDSVIGILAMNHPSSDGEVLGGWIDGDRAQLRVRGKDEFGRTVRGRVALKNDGGIWKVGDGTVR